VQTALRRNAKIEHKANIVTSSLCVKKLPVVPCFFLYPKELHVGTKGAMGALSTPRWFSIKYIPFKTTPL
jgi:hypothetical protein